MMPRRSLAFLLALASCTLVFAQTTAPADPLAALIQQLHSPRYATRAAATQELLHLNPDRRPMIEEALAHETDPEAATRLEQVAVHLLMKGRTLIEGDIGVLGISLQMEAVQLDPKQPTVQMSIVVLKTQPGFPAAEELDPCDRILGINGERFTLQTTADDFRRKINDTPPGTVLQFSVLRDGKRLDIPVRVAGLRTEDAPLLLAIVQQRDSLIASYLESLPNGAKSKPLVIADDAAAAGGDRRIEGVMPAIVPAAP
jgi:C-terminal processing protease CtpA/Prc